MERFLNFLAPGTSRDLWYGPPYHVIYQHHLLVFHVNSKEIYFEKLKDLKIKSIGFFGTREEIVDMLRQIAGCSETILQSLKLDDHHQQSIEPGIHAILPVNLQHSQWDGVIFVFYWPMTASFDAKRTMKATKSMRKV